MTEKLSPFSLQNIRLFILFRVFFNARFYYPVFTILFLDYGLSIEQFSLLNTVWAFTIVLAEVPSGALADLIGRKRLMISTAWLMLFEMATIAFVPLGNSTIIFTAFFINRVLSGLAEAMASGADEAMAYDTLVETGLEKQWPKVLDYQMRAQHLGYIIAMTIGAMAYDAGMVNRLLGWLGSDVQLSQQITMRFPVYLTLVLAFFSMLITTRMRDPLVQADHAAPKEKASILQVFTMVLRAGGWIVRTPFVLAVILFAMVIDHVMRMLVTMTSQYFRLISLPEASFGVIGSAVAVLGLFVPGIARVMANRFSAGINAAVLIIFSLIALFLLTLFIPFWGILPVMMLFICLTMTSFFTSHYLNELTSSEKRATVLSFKGMAYNVAYGMTGVLYAGLITHLKAKYAQLYPQWTGDMLGDAAFQASISWFPWYMTGALVLVFLVCLPRMLVRN
ncbi:MAG: MFS transporter [Desulfobulbus propionicus]|nr:MAG: MFS transporter [Desulfobulbus propionicus]